MSLGEPGRKADLSSGLHLDRLSGEGAPSLSLSFLVLKWRSGPPVVPVVRTPHFHQRARVRELRSHLLRDMAKKRMKWRSGYFQEQMG